MRNEITLTLKQKIEHSLSDDVRSQQLDEIKDNLSNIEGRVTSLEEQIDNIQNNDIANSDSTETKE